MLKILVTIIDFFDNGAYKKRYAFARLIIATLISGTVVTHAMEDVNKFKNWEYIVAMLSYSFYLYLYYSVATAAKNLHRINKDGYIEDKE